jgi:hypothetical protein
MMKTTEENVGGCVVAKNHEFVSKGKQPIVSVLFSRGLCGVFA